MPCRSKFNWRVLGLLSLAILISACGGGSGDGGNNGGSGSEDPVDDQLKSGFDYVDMFTNLAENIILPNYIAFKNAAETFAAPDGALSNYCLAIDSIDEASRLDDARDAWRELMSLWQMAEVHNLGPAEDQASLLRNRIYAYDSQGFNACRTDRAFVLAEDPEFNIATRTFDARGIDALEYVLFETSFNHRCTEVDPQTEFWDARPLVARKQVRCAYGQWVLDDIIQAVDTIIDEWSRDGGDYLSTFTSSDESIQALVLESISDALFYIEKDTKDIKLGIPTGLRNSGCDAIACPDAVESPFSGHGLQNIRANLTAFITLFTGNGGLSFDDLIADAGFSSVNNGFIDDVNAAITLTDSLIAEGDLASLSQAILDSGSATECENSNANPDNSPSVPLCALHGYLKRINDRLRTDFVTIVGVDLPDRAQGDTD